MHWFYFKHTIQSLPELADVPPARRRDVWEQIRRNSKWLQVRGLWPSIILSLSAPLLLTLARSWSIWTTWGVCGILVLAQLIWQTLAARATHRHLRKIWRFCTTCGYDLRATPPGAPCPECATPAPPCPESARAAQNLAEMTSDP